MTLDEWIDELKYGDLDSIKDRLDAIELIEFLEELKERRKAEQLLKVRGYYRSRYHF